MSVGGEALIYNCHHPLEHADAASPYSRKVTGPARHVSNGARKYSRSMSSCVPSSSCEALRYAVAALNRLDDFNCEKIGAGFFSEVFKVTHRTTGQVMVLKMNTSLSNRPNMLREVQLMNRLSHDNILKFMGVCVHEGQLHALTEYINGGSLEQLLQNKLIDLPWETRIKLSLDIARGMCYLHSRGVFHRDLTSKNVLIKINSDGMTAVIGDFGLAEKIPDPRDRSQRLPIVGSPYWMAPECLNGKWYNEKADVFSYGIILCEIIARVEADPDILPRTENFGVDYVTFSDMCPDCPPQFLEIAFSSCRIDPDSRPSFKEIVCQLETFLNIFSSMSGGSNLFYPPVVYSPCRDDGDNIDSVRAIFAHGWTRSTLTQNRLETKSCTTPTKVPTSTTQPPPVTPKHIGEAMSMQDPHYKPNSSSQNPFASLPRFWKGKKFLELSVSDMDLSHSVNLGLVSPKYAPTPPGTPVSQEKLSTRTVCHKAGKKLSKSLPTSPVLQRKSKTMYSNSSTVEVPDSPRSVSPGPSFSPPSSLSPFEPDESFSGYNSVQEQMSDCKLEDSCNQYQEGGKIHLSNVAVPRESSAVVTFRTKTPSLCAKLRRLSGESGFFSVGDRNSNCDLSLDSYHNQDDLSSWTTDSSAESQLNDSPSDTDDNGQTNGSGRKRPSSYYSDDSCCCCGNNSHNCCELRLGSQIVPEGSSPVPYINLPNCPKSEVQSSADIISYPCQFCNSDSSCSMKGPCILKEFSSHVGNIQAELEPSSTLSRHDHHLARHVSNGQSKTCEKGNKVVKCMRTSPEI